MAVEVITPTIDPLSTAILSLNSKSSYRYPSFTYVFFFILLKTLLLYLKVTFIIFSSHSFAASIALSYNIP